MTRRTIEDVRDFAALMAETEAAMGVHAHYCDLAARLEAGATPDAAVDGMDAAQGDRAMPEEFAATLPPEQLDALALSVRVAFESVLMTGAARALSAADLAGVPDAELDPGTVAVVALGYAGWVPGTGPGS